MKTKRVIAAIVLNLLVLVLWDGSALAASHVGSVMSLQGRVTIDRGGAKISPAVNDPVALGDVMSTSGASSVKLQFADGSRLTLGENTSVVIKDFITENKEKSLFDLLEGKVHVVTATGNFRIQTSTAIVAAQGGTCAVVEACARNQERCVRVIDGGIDVCDTTLAGCKPFPAGTVGEGITGAGSGKAPGTEPGKEAPAGSDVCWGDYCTHGVSATSSEPPGLCATCPGGGGPPAPPSRSLGIIDLIWP